MLEVGAEQGSRTQYIWSHRWVLNGGSSGAVTYDGKFINDYMINPETRTSGANSNQVGIGVLFMNLDTIWACPTSMTLT